MLFLAIGNKSPSSCTSDSFVCAMAPRAHNSPRGSAERARDVPLAQRGTVSTASRCRGTSASALVRHQLSVHETRPLGTEGDRQHRQQMSRHERQRPHAAPAERARDAPLGTRGGPSAPPADVAARAPAPSGSRTQTPPPSDGGVAPPAQAASTPPPSPRGQGAQWDPWRHWRHGSVPEPALS